MAIPVSELLTKLGLVLNDEDHERWTEEELIGWINDAAGEIVVRRPPAGAVTETVSLAEGALQSIPAGGLQLLDVVRNVSHAGKGPIQRTTRYLLETQDQDWYSATPKAYVRHFTFDDLTPTQFYVWPAVAAATTVSIVYSKAPAAVDDSADSVALGREYTGPILSYVLYRALGKDSEYSNGVSALAHYQAFSDALQTNNQTQVAVSPNANQT